MSCSEQLEERGCSSNEEEEEEEEDDDVDQFMMSDNSSRSFPFPSPSSSTSQGLWLRSFDSQREIREPLPAAAAAAAAAAADDSIIVNRNFDFVDLSLRTSNDESAAAAASGSEIKPVEKEHMFDKVVTPSDVGKLNRLVIPKQHAEKYFPLDSSSTEKGLLLNFEDRNGKSWRFRYSYWNSSQSYVMTKGWSRFVKEKKLDAGDIVSFQRGVGEVGRSRFFIDWRRRPDVVLPDPGNFGGFQFQNQFSFVPPSVRWGRLYSLPQTASFPRSFEPSPRLNFAGYNPYDHHHYHHRYQQQEQRIGHPAELRAVGFGNVSQIYARSSSATFPSGPRIGTTAQEVGPPTVIESVPVVVPASKVDAGKRLRLFGVNMECGTDDDSSSSSSSSLQSRMHAECSKKGKSSLSFDLDL